MDLWASLVSLTDHLQFSVPLMTSFVRLSYRFSSSHLSDLLESESSKLVCLAITYMHACTFYRAVMLVYTSPGKERRRRIISNLLTAGWWGGG